eukprot:c23931_g1_i1.p2 GENE.c23931_g1_i1~~c23931_g1_i1.p2  ORF type:complete len:217 (+),score=44.11 c23931_g1_i1:165-815(+)
MGRASVNCITQDEAVNEYLRIQSPTKEGSILDAPRCGGLDFSRVATPCESVEQSRVGWPAKPINVNGPFKVACLESHISTIFLLSERNTRTFSVFALDFGVGCFFAYFLAVARRILGTNTNPYTATTPVSITMAVAINSCDELCVVAIAGPITTLNTIRVCKQYATCRVSFHTSSNLRIKQHNHVPAKHNPQNTAPAATSTQTPRDMSHRHITCCS